MTAPLPLEDFQEVAARFLAEREHALLADEMGVGKTPAGIRAVDLVGARTVLVLVPASNRINWLREFEKFSPMDRPAKALMTGKDRVGDAAIVVCSYELAADKKVFKDLCAVEWDVLILDEAHLLKSRAAKRTKAVYGAKTDNVGGIAGHAQRCWRMTGTAAPNHVAESWTHLHSAGIYKKNWYDFVAEFCTGYEGDYGFKITGTKNAEALRTLIAPFMLRRTKSEVLPGMVALTFETVELQPGPVDIEILFPDWLQGRTIAEFTADLERINKEVAATLAGKEGDAKMAAITALAASTSALRRYVGCSIVKAYVEQVRGELERNEIDKLVIFAHHRVVIRELESGLKAFHPCAVYGGTPAEKRERLIEAFKTNKNRRVFIGQLQAAGTALNLQVANRLDFVEMSWVPGENAQAANRIHRFGQTRECHVRYFGVGKGVHRDIMEANVRKTTELMKAGL